MLMKKLVLIVLVALAVFLGYQYIYQDHRDIATEIPSFDLSSESLFSEFESNLQSSETKYLDKTLHVKGIITELNAADLTLDGKIFCTFSSHDKIKLGDKVLVKGRCLGYDDLLELVKMDQCIITLL